MDVVAKKDFSSLVIMLVIVVLVMYVFLLFPLTQLTSMSIQDGCSALVLFVIVPWSLCVKRLVELVSRFIPALAVVHPLFDEAEAAREGR